MTTEMKPWQKGYRLDELQEVARIFAATDKDHVYGAYGTFKENAVADAQARGHLVLSPSRKSAVVRFRPKRGQPVKDFAERERAQISAGDLVVKRFACLPGGEDELFSGLATLEERGPFWVHCWQESEIQREIVDGLGLEHVATKVSAASELIGVWSNQLGSPPDGADEVGITRLDHVPVPYLMDAVGCLGEVPEMAQHYSSYNKGHAWSALSLRGFSDDPGFIIKPAEMSKGWKKDNPDLIDNEVRDTALRGDFPEFEPIISAIPGEKQRIRLMRLEPGGGELTRHADVTDPEAGTADGCVMRIHVPLQTNPDVMFEQWLLDGRKQHVHMAAGGVWYLDTRKPHTAINGGTEARIHLVLDVFANDELRVRLLQGETA